MLLSSDAQRLWLGLPRLALAVALVTGCADARGRFQDFQKRLELDAGTVPEYDGGPCEPPAPGSVNGPALLAIDTSLTGGHPILFLGSIDTPALEGTTAVHFVYRALDSKDRSTRVGDELDVGPFPLHDGELIAKVPESTLDGRANPLLYNAPITSEMTLSGHICGISELYCGTLTGITSGLISGPFDGTFAITLLSGPDAVPEQPRYGCDASQIAPAL